MKLRFVTVLTFLLSIGTLAFAADTMTGYISDSHCGAKGAKAGHEECATKCVKEHGAKYVFVNDADHKVYAIDNQDKVAAHAGHHVTVTGTAQGDNLKLDSIAMAK
jgi:sugar lactone lactonase YvrE